MEGKKKKKDYQRTSQEQLEAYLQFINDNPEIKAGKNDPKNPRRVEELWNALSKQLNALKGPIKTSREWKITLTHWKNQVRSRARKQKAAKAITGGGPPLAETTNKFEERALEMFGNIVIDGNPKLETLGLQLEEEDFVDAHMSEPTTHFVHQSSSSLDSEYSDPNTPLKSTPKSKAITVEHIYENVVELIEQKNKTDQEFRNEFLAMQKRTTEALDKMGDGISAMVEVLKTLKS